MPAATGKRSRMLERQPQRPLAAHADAEDADGARRRLPALGKERQHVVEQVLLGRQRADRTRHRRGRPTRSGRRADRRRPGSARRTSGVYAGRSRKVSRPRGCRNSTPKRGLASGRVVDVGRFAGDVDVGPGLPFMGRFAWRAETREAAGVQPRDKPTPVAYGLPARQID